MSGNKLSQPGDQILKFFEAERYGQGLIVAEFQYNYDTCLNPEGEHKNYWTDRDWVEDVGRELPDGRYLATATYKDGSGTAYGVRVANGRVHFTPSDGVEDRVCRFAIYADYGEKKMRTPIIERDVPVTRVTNATDIGNIEQICRDLDLDIGEYVVAITYGDGSQGLRFARVEPSDMKVVVVG